MRHTQISKSLPRPPLLQRLPGVHFLLALLAGVLSLAVACESPRDSRSAGDEASPSAESESPAEEGAESSTSGPESESDEYSDKRSTMVRRQLAARDIDNAEVLAAMKKVPRHELVPEAVKSVAYDDTPLPIGEDQTISQPYIVALMTQLLELEPGCKVLDVGTGSGYQAAVLAELCDEVYSIEIVEPLAERAAKDLERLGYDNVTVKAGDGYQGWKEHAPFDGIIVAAAPPKIPEPLVEQLADGARLVVPVGATGGIQQLTVVEKTADGATTRELLPVRFVPMTGEAQD